MNTRTKFVDNHCPENPRPEISRALEIIGAQMAVDCMNALAVLNGPGGMWREYEVGLAVHRELGPRPRHSCVCGVAVRTTWTLAQRDGLPWPTLEATLERMMTETPKDIPDEP